MNLQCPRCHCTKRWERSKQPDGPGGCHCGTFQDWKVVPEKQVGYCTWTPYRRGRLPRCYDYWY